MASVNIARPPLNPDAVPWSPQLTPDESNLLTRLNPISWLIERARDVPRSPFISNYQAPSPDHNDCQLQTLPLIPSLITIDPTTPHTYDALVHDSESWEDAQPRQMLEYLKFLSDLSVENCSNQFEQLLQKVADQKENYLIDDGPLPSDVPFIVTPLPPAFPPRRVRRVPNDNQSADQFVAQNSITYVNYDCNNPDDLNAELTRREERNISINPPYVMTLSFTSSMSSGPMLNDQHNIVISSNHPFELTVLKNVYKLLQISSDIDTHLEDITGMNNIFDRATDTVTAFKRAAEAVKQEDADRAAAGSEWVRDEASDASSDAGSDSGSDDGFVIRNDRQPASGSNSGDSSPAVARDPRLQQDIEYRVDEYLTLAGAHQPGFDILSDLSRDRFYYDVFPDILTALTDELSSLFNRLNIHDPNWGIARGANSGAYTFDMLYGAYMNTPPRYNDMGDPPGRLAKLIDRKFGEISDIWREVIKGSVELPQNIIDELVTEMALPEPAAISSEEIVENAQRAVAAHEAANPADPMDVYDKLGELCSVCYGNPIDIDLKHRGTFHHIICSQCADLLERADGHQNCPLDRQRIEEQRPSNVAAAKKAYYDAVVSHDAAALPELERTVRTALQTATVSNIDNDTFEHLAEIASAAAQPNPPRSLQFISSKSHRKRSHKKSHKRSHRRVVKRHVK